MSLVGALVLGGGAQAGNNPIDAEVNLNCNTPANIGVLTRSFEKIKVNVNWSPGTEVLFKFTDKDCQGNSNCQIEVTESTGTGTWVNTAPGDTTNPYLFPVPNDFSSKVTDPSGSGTKSFILDKATGVAVNYALSCTSPAASLKAEKLADPSSFSTEDKEINYTIEVKNTGEAPLTGLVVNDPLIGSAPLTCYDQATGGSSITTVPVSGFAYCRGSYTVQPNDETAGKIVNTATVDTDQTTPVTVTSTVLATRTSVPSIQIVKSTQETGFSAPGETLVYDITVKNNGAVGLTSIVLTDDLPGATFSPENCGLGTGYTLAPTLAPGSSTTCTVTYQIAQGDLDKGSVSNVARVVAKTTEPTPREVSDSSETVVVAISETRRTLDLDKTSTSTSFSKLGETILYSYEVTNTGNVTLKGPFTVTDDKIENISCPDTSSLALAPKASFICTASYTVTQLDLDAGFVTNIATAKGAGVDPPQDTLTVKATQTKSLSLKKEANKLSFSAVDEEIIYTYVVKNDGNVTLAGPITVDDDKISSVSCPSLASNVLAPGADTTCTATYKVTQADLDAGFVTNIAQARAGAASGSDLSASPSNEVQSNKAEVTVPGKQLQGLSLTKTANPETFSAAGQVITYTITATNDGNVTLTGLTVKDPLDDDGTVNCPTYTIAPGSSVACIATYTIEPEDLKPGNRITNTASATTKEVQEPVTASVTITADLDVEIEDTVQSTTYNFMAKRLDLLAMHGPRLSWLVNRAEDGFGQGSNGFNVVGEGGNITGDFAFNSGMLRQGGRGSQVMPTADTPPVRSDGVNVWIEGQFAFYNDDREDENAEGDFFVGYAGADMELMDRVILGVMAEIDWMSEDTDSASVEGTGWMIGPYLSAEIADGMFLDLRGMRGWSDNSVDQDIEGLTYSGDFGTDRWLAEATLTGNFDLNAFKLTPDIRFLYIWEGQEDFSVNGNADAVDVSGNDVSLTQLSSGLRLAHLSQMDGFDMRSYIAGRLFWNIDDPGELTVDGQFISDDEMSASVTLGMDVRSEAMQFGIEGTYDGFFSEDNAIGGRLSFGYQF